MYNQTIANFFSNYGLMFVFFQILMTFFGYLSSTSIDISSKLDLKIRPKNYHLLSYFALQVFSGIDSKTLMTAPRSEKISVGSLSFWMVFTLFFLVGINYHTMQNFFEDKDYALYAAIGIGFIVFMFDRMILNKSFYEDGHRIFQKNQNLNPANSNIAKFEEYKPSNFLYTSRILLSIFFSLFMTQFFLLTHYKPSIDNRIRLDYVAKTDISSKKEEFLINYDSYNQKLEDQITNLKKITKVSEVEVNGNKSIIPELYAAQITMLEEKIKDLSSSINLNITKRDEALLKSKIETEGTKRPNYSAKQAGTGKEARTFQTEADIADKEIKRLNLSLEPEIANLKNLIATRNQEIAKASQMDIDLSRELSFRRGNRQLSLNNFEKEYLSSNTGQKISTDSIARMKALLNVFYDDAAVVGFTIFISFIFFLLLEMMPIIVKFFYFPDTNYALKIFTESINKNKYEVLQSENERLIMIRESETSLNFNLGRALNSDNSYNFELQKEANVTTENSLTNSNNHLFNVKIANNAMTEKNLEEDIRLLKSLEAKFNLTGMDDKSRKLIIEAEKNEILKNFKARKRA